MQVIKAGLDGSTLDLDEGEEQFEEQGVASDFESCSDEEDMDMQVIKDMILTKANYIIDSVLVVSLFYDKCSFLCVTNYYLSSLFPKSA